MAEARADMAEAREEMERIRGVENKAREEEYALLEEREKWSRKTERRGEVMMRMLGIS